MRKVESTRTLCDYYNEIVYEVGRLTEMCGNTDEALKLRNDIYDMLTVKFSEPLDDIAELQEELGCPLDVVAHLVMYKPFYYKDENGDLHEINSYELFNKDLIFYMSWTDVDIYAGENGDIEIPLSEYKKSFWLKEDKSE